MLWPLNPTTAMLTIEEQRNILGQLFAGGTALAGLVLVFMGSILTAYDSFDATAKRSVRAKYQKRAWIAFLGFIAALVAAAAGMVGLIFGPTLWLSLGIVALVASGILLVFMALLSVREVS
jgi:hypothetical protein